MAGSGAALSFSWCTFHGNMNPIHPGNVMLLILSGLNAVLCVLAPDDSIDDIEVRRRTGDEIEIHVIWHDGDVFSQSLFRGEWSAAEIIYRIFGEMQDYLADSDMAWGQSRPLCPGHTHPRSLVREGARLRWNCPADGVGPFAFPDLLDPENSGPG